jgi:hypothetical protein
MIDVEDALRGMFEARAEEMGLPPSLPASVSKRAKRRQLRNGVAVTFVVLTLTATGILGTESMHLFRSGERPAHSSTEVALARFEGGGLSFSYPASWRPFKYDLVGSQFASIVYLSNQQLHDPCVRTATSASCGRPLGRLQPGGVLAEWTVWGSDHARFSEFSGSDITVGGRPAKIQVERDWPLGCGGVIANVAMRVTISRPDTEMSWYAFDACLRGPNVEVAEQQVRALLDSVVFMSD